MLKPGDIVRIAAVADRRFLFVRETPVTAKSVGEICDGCQGEILPGAPLILSEHIPRFQPDGLRFCIKCCVLVGATDDRT